MAIQLDILLRRLAQSPYRHALVGVPLILCIIFIFTISGSSPTVDERAGLVRLATEEDLQQRSGMFPSLVEESSKMKAEPVEVNLTEDDRGTGDMREMEAEIMDQRKKEMEEVGAEVVEVKENDQEEPQQGDAVESDAEIDKTREALKIETDAPEVVNEMTTTSDKEDEEAEKEKTAEMGEKSIKDTGNDVIDAPTNFSLTPTSFVEEIPSSITTAKSADTVTLPSLEAILANAQKRNITVDSMVSLDTLSESEPETESVAETDTEFENLNKDETSVEKEKEGGIETIDTEETSEKEGETETVAAKDVDTERIIV